MAIILAHIEVQDEEADKAEVARSMHHECFWGPGIVRLVKVTDVNGETIYQPNDEVSK